MTSMGESEDIAPIAAECFNAANEEKFFTDAPIGKTFSSGENELAVALEDESLTVNGNPDDGADVARCLRCWKLLNSGKIPSSDDLRELLQVVDRNRARDLLANFPNLKGLIVGFNRWFIC